MTLTEFRRRHGDPAGWSSAEFEAWLSESDRTRDVHERLDQAADFIESHPAASSAEILAVFQGGGVR